MIALIDYGAGNVQSVRHALHRLGTDAVLTRDPELIRAASHVIFPGVGAAGHAMAQLADTGLPALLPTLSQPFLGICLGMQLMCSHSEEDDTPGLGIFPTSVHRFPATGKVPHMGWNDCQGQSGPLFAGLAEGQDFYFVHSYHARIPEGAACVSARCEYLLPFAAALSRANFHGVQFHPERSGPAGSQLLQNFLAL